MTHSPEDSTYFQQSVFNEDVWFYGNVYGLENTVVGNAGISSISKNLSNVSVLNNEIININANNVGIVSYTQQKTDILNTNVIGETIEKAVINTTALTGTVNIDVLNGSLYYFTSNSTGNWTNNIRGSDTVTLNSLLNIGDSITITLFATQGSSAYLGSSLKVDNVTISPKWQGGTAPSTGNTNSVDAYTFSIFKTADATYTSFASQTKFT
jgi:hypothetical protein